MQDKITQYNSSGGWWATIKKTSASAAYLGLEYFAASVINIKVTSESQFMALQILTTDLLLFNLSHPAHNIAREIFAEILINFTFN